MKYAVQQQGVAIVTALLLTTLAITLVTSLFWQQQVQVRSIENQRLQLQKQWILLGALDWARLILREDARYSSVDYVGEPWSVPLAETRLGAYVDDARSDGDINDASLSGNIVDAQSRFNLSNLCVDGTIDPVAVAIFARLLASQQVNPDLAMAAAQLKRVAQQKAGDGKDASGAQPLDITQPDDLLAVAGFTPEMLARIRDFVVALPRATPVNMNTASPEVMAAMIDTLPLSDARALARSRDASYFRDQSDLLQRLQGKTLQQSASYIAFASAYFIVHGKVHLRRATLDVQALIERLGSQTKVIWIAEN